MSVMVNEQRYTDPKWLFWDGMLSQSNVRAALTLVGFGAIGFAMRRRSTKVPYAWLRNSRHHANSWPVVLRYYWPNTFTISVSVMRAFGALNIAMATFSYLSKSSLKLCYDVADDPHASLWHDRFITQ